MTGRGGNAARFRTAADIQFSGSLIARRPASAVVAVVAFVVVVNLAVMPRFAAAYDALGDRSPLRRLLAHVMLDLMVFLVR